MTLLQIYFTITGTILLVKFFHGIFTLKRLKTFTNVKRNLINKQLIDNPLFSYSDLFIYHFSTNSIKDESYEKEMTDFLTKEGTNYEIIIYIIFALTWVISVPSVLLCVLIGWLGERFEKFAKSILS